MSFDLRQRALENFSELTSEGFCVLSGEGRIELSDGSVTRLLGYAPEALQGGSILDLLHEDERSSAREALAALGASPDAAERQTAKLDLTSRFRHADGHLVSVHWRGRGEGDSWFVLLRDVSPEQALQHDLQEARQALQHRLAEHTSELQRTGTALRESEALFRAISKELPDALFLLDQESDPLGRIVHANPAACEQHLYTFEEITELTIFDLDDDTTAGENRSRLGRVQSGETVTFEGQHHRKDGSVFPVEVVAREIYYQGRRLVLAIERDLSERKWREEETRRLHTQVVQAQKLETLGVLAGGIAHDFNNLLVGILGNAGLALDELTGESEIRPYLEGIEDASERAADLCRQMLAYSGKGQFVLESLCLDELVREMAPLLWASVSRKAELELELEETSPVRADSEQMRQLILSLVSNASDALGDCSGQIRIALRQMQLSGEDLADAVLDEKLPTGPYVVLEVVDTGEGMEESTRQRLFDPFYTTKFTGRGMGLAAVLGIVRGHHGAVKVESEPGRGSTFAVMLPAQRELAAAPERQAGADLFDAGVVLVVDDESTVRDVVRRSLEKAGYTAIVAHNGGHALELFDDWGPELCCVVLDLSMPDPDGRATLERLRRRRPDLPVIMVSGYAAEHAAALFSGERPNVFLQKPFRSQQLLALVEQIKRLPIRNLADEGE